MSWLLHIHPIRLFNFYLTLAFIVTTLLNVRNYRHMLGLAHSLPGRWPRLLKLLSQHAHILMTWSSVAPILTSAGLLAVQMFVTRVVAPSADEKLTGALLWEIWPALLFVLVTSALMVAFDVYTSWPTEPFDRSAIEKHFDQAEFWLKSWTAPVVRVLSFGYVNPRNMVAAEVRTALLEASTLLNQTLWWTAAQAGFRILCGLSLWLTYALSGWLQAWLTGE